MSVTQVNFDALGGGAKVARFTNVTVGTETKPFDCGFEPKYILVIVSQANVSGGYIWEYDADVSTQYYSYTTDNKTWSNNGPIGTSTGWVFTLGSVDTTGFSVYNNGGGGALTVHTAIAIG